MLREVSTETCDVTLQRWLQSMLPVMSFTVVLCHVPVCNDIEMLNNIFQAEKLGSDTCLLDSLD